MNDADMRLFKHLLGKVIRIEDKLDQLLAKKKRKPRSATSDYPDWFEDMWINYPKRAGSNPKGRAMTAVSARLQLHTGLYNIDLEQGVERYRKFCDATGKTGTEFVMQAATFFGPDKHYENDWAIPKPKADPYAKPDVYSQAHKTVDVDKIGRGDADLDTSTNPYAEDMT